MDKALEEKILSLLAQNRIMTIATLRPDGWPQATTVGYANDGLTLYFLCGPESQKAMNLARDERVSLTIDHDTPQVMEITGLSMAARAHAVTDPAEAERAMRLVMARYTEPQTIPLPIHALCLRRAPVPGHARRHLGARLQQGLRPHRPGALLADLLERREQEVVF